MREKTKILMAEDHKLMRVGLKAIFEDYDDLEVVTEEIATSNYYDNTSKQDKMKNVLFYYFCLCWVFTAALGLSLVVVHRLLTVAASRCRAQALGAQAQQLWLPGSKATALEHRLSCSTAGGILPDQGLSLCPLHWQMES